MFFNLIKEINRLREEINTLLSDVFNSIKEINRLRKEINVLLSKGMSNIYLLFVCLLSLFQVGIYNSIKTNKKTNLRAYTRSSLDHLIKKHNKN